MLGKVLGERLNVSKVLPLSAALTGKAGQGPIVAIGSGGNIDPKTLCDILNSIVS